MRSSTECARVTHLSRYLPNWLRRGKARSHRIFYPDKLVSGSRISQGPAENKLLLAPPKLLRAETGSFISSQQKLGQDVS